MDLMSNLEVLSSVFDILFMFDFKVEMEAYMLEIWNLPALGNICLELDFNGVRDLNYGLIYFF